VLELFFAIGATHIEASSDSLVVVYKKSKVYQCFDESLNMYLDQSLDIISTLEYVSISHISRQDIWIANELAQQASGYHVNRSVFIYLISRCLLMLS
jgi:predicted nucleotide-binding protein (sugar kinase/HSP70/actin superfamily)